MHTAVLRRVQSHDQFAPVHPAAHFAAEQKREAAEHFFLGEPFFRGKMLANAFRKLFVESHRMHLLVDRRQGRLETVGLGAFVYRFVQTPKVGTDLSRRRPRPSTAPSRSEQLP